MKRLKPLKDYLKPSGPPAPKSRNQGAAKVRALMERVAKKQGATNGAR